ncbi:MAG: magnesium transporter [Spirochaetaceae bacterium]|nr:MAG: magnesium transporter [Spirochaetaceae bacterium]
MILSPETIQDHHDAMARSLAEGDLDTATDNAQHLSSTRIAQILRDAPRDAVVPMLGRLDRQRVGRVFARMSIDLVADLLLATEPGELAILLEMLTPDQAASLITALPDDERDAAIDRFPEAKRAEIMALVAFPPGSAGSVMSPRFLSIEQNHTVRDTIEALHSAPADLDRTTYVYVIDSDRRPVGVVSVRDLLRLKADSQLARVMNPSVVAVGVNDTAVEAATLIRNRRLTMLPVLDADATIAGVITFDDAIDILSEEVASQTTGIGGGSPDESFFTPPRSAIRMRLPWMVSNIFLNLGAVAVITGFEETIAAVAILAAFLPMITDMGGNVGIQSLSVAVRSIALGEVRLRDAGRALRKELSIGVVNGLVLGSVFLLIAVVWQRNALIGVIAGTALAANVLVAGVVGGTLPFLIKRLGKDPAMMTGPVLTTITDITGVTIYLGLSTIFLLT